MEYWKLGLGDDVLYVRADLDEYLAEYFEPGVGWVRNDHYAGEIYYNGNGVPATTEEVAQLAA